MIMICDVRMETSVIAQSKSYVEPEIASSQLDDVQGSGALISRRSLGQTTTVTVTGYTTSYTFSATTTTSTVTLAATTGLLCLPNDYVICWIIIIRWLSPSSCILWRRYGQWDRRRDRCRLSLDALSCFVVVLVDELLLTLLHWFSYANTRAFFKSYFRSFSVILDYIDYRYKN